MAPVWQVFTYLWRLKSAISLQHKRNFILRSKIQLRLTVRSTLTNNAEFQLRLTIANVPSYNLFL